MGISELKNRIGTRFGSVNFLRKKKVDVMITAFRDGFQSVYGARVLTKDFLPAVEAAAEAGFDHFEAGGGARFQSLYFYCNENAFDNTSPLPGVALNLSLSTIVNPRKIAWTF